MTPGTLDRPVPPGQGIVGGLVIELCGTLPTILCVTVGTDLTRELGAVGIVLPMTSYARRGQTQVRALQSVMLRPDAPHCSVGDQLRGVTLPTRDLGVVSFEREPNAVVFERRRVQANEREVGPKVLFVACGAVAVSHGRMVPESRLDPRAKQLVTCETQIVRNATFPQTVTLRASPNTLQIGVC